jgi:hypothetical protein
VPVEAAVFVEAAVAGVDDAPVDDVEAEAEVDEDNIGVGALAAAEAAAAAAAEAAMYKC